MEFLDTYMNELVLGGSSTIGAFLVTILKKFGNRLTKIDERLMELEKKIDINTALDKERQKK